MKLVELSNAEFHEFVSMQKNSSFYQTLEYQRFMEENDFETELIGLKDNFGNVRAASLIALKPIDNKYFYGYAPRGFYIDYNDSSFVNDFVKSLTKYYKSRNVVFIKINPNIIISKYNKVKNKFIENDNINIINSFKKNKFQELKNNMYFEALLPKYNPIVSLRDFSFRGLDKNVRNKISKSYRKGLSVEKKGIEGIKELYPLIKNKTKKNIEYYGRLYRSFETSKLVDIFLVKIDFEEFLINTKDKYQKIQEENNMLVKKVINNNNLKVLNQKMQSDKELLVLKNDIVKATQGLSKGKKKVIAGAIVIKHKDKAHIFVSGYNRRYRDCNAIDFLYYKLMEYYKFNYNYLDLDGFSGDLSDNNPYSGLNNFKLGFKPDIYELIGEYDIVFDNKNYNKYASNGTLSNIFKEL